MENYLQRLNDIWGSDINDSKTALKWIENSVEYKQEEDLYLDFKQKSDSQDPLLNDDDKANIAKAISGFSNTDGGFIIWGVKAKSKKKDEPDVAIELTPISNLKLFQTSLNSLCGSLVNPPVAGVHSRPVPKGPDEDVGYVITVIPKKRDTLVQASAKKNKGFYIRSGSGFYLLPEVLIGEFYRRKHSPILNLSLQLSEPHLVEELIEAEHWEQTMAPERVHWGRCTYRQNIDIDWTAKLKNDGLGSANQVVVHLTVQPSDNWSIISFDNKKNYYQETSGGLAIPMYSPEQTTHFNQVKTNAATGKLLEPIHPGQEIAVAKGTLSIPLDTFEHNVVEFEVSGIAYATDSTPFSLIWHMGGAEFKSRYLKAYLTIREQSKPSTRVIPAPPPKQRKWDL